MPISPAQCRAARALVRWSREELAVKAGKGYRCVLNFECETRDVRPETKIAIKDALEAAGVVFVDADFDGPGVLLRRM